MDKTFDELLALLDKFPAFMSMDGCHWLATGEQDVVAARAAAAIRDLEAKLEASRQVNKVLRTDADQNCTRATTAESRLREVEAALWELVKLKDAKERFEELSARMTTGAEMKERKRLDEYYKAGKEPAWESARAALAPERTVARQEPTAEMYAAGYTKYVELSNLQGYIAWRNIKECFAAMLTAAPASPLLPGLERAVAPVEHLWIVRFDKEIYAAYPSKRQAEVYASGFSRAETLTIEMMTIHSIAPPPAVPASPLLPGLERAAEICSDWPDEFIPNSHTIAVVEKLVSAIRAEISRLKGEGSDDSPT